MKIRRLRTGLLVAVSSVLGSLLAAEGILRLFPAVLPSRVRETIDDSPQKGSVPHPYIGHLNKPDHVTDPHGFRNTWPWPDAPGIITLGDSVTFGRGVDQAATWPSVLATRIHAQSVVNLAVGASGPQQYVRVFETFGLRLQPKLILIGFFARNDFWDASMFERWLRSGAKGNYLVWRDLGRPANVSGGLGRPVRKLARTAQWRGELAARKTHLGNLLLYAAGRARPWTPFEDGVEVYEVPDGTRLKLESQKLLRRATQATRTSPVFGHVVASLERIHALAHQRDASTLVILLPSREEVYLSLMRGRQSTPDLSASLRDALEERGIPYLDLLEDFRRAAASGDSVFLGTDDPLLSARGHALIAERLAARLGWRPGGSGLRAGM